MKHPPFSVQAVTATDRHQAIAAIGDSLTTHGGWVADLHLFSNKAATIRFELPAGRIADWLAALSAIGLRLDPVSLPDMPPDTEIAGSLAVTFMHGEPDLVRAIPSVPG